MFQVTVHFDHKFQFNTDVSKNSSQIVDEIVHDMEDRTENVFKFFNFMGIVTSFCFICVLVRAVRYKMKYLTRDDYDNHYISQDFKDVDEERKRLDHELALPLTRKERGKYIELTSIKLIKSEKIRIARTMVFLFISSMQILSIIAMDYSLFWLLATIRYHGLKQAGVQSPEFVTLGVEGSGILADLYQGIIKSFQPITDEFRIDLLPCLPNPVFPDFSKYLQISIIIFICWIFAVIEPYGLRARQTVMRAYYPERAKERAVWLYSEILLKRTSFIKFARRKLREKVTKNVPKQEFGLMDMIRAKTNQFWLCRKIFGRRKLNNCMLCGIKLRKVDDSVKCINPSCSGIYCAECFYELKNTCSLCMEPIEYDDFSDVSEER